MTPFPLSDMLSRSKVFLHHRITSDRITVELQALALDERRFELIFPPGKSFETSDGIPYEDEYIRILVGEGLRWARSRLQLDNGISVDISLLSGVVDFENEAGLCIAVALCIVRQLGADLNLTDLGGNDWKECT